MHLVGQTYPEFGSMSWTLFYVKLQQLLAIFVKSVCVWVWVCVLFHLVKPYVMRTVLTSHHKWISSV